ncbi:MAG: hypothetical protein RLZZ373_1856 [Pseudomonadota bacterium]|jgi:hypothetical protein
MDPLALNATAWMPTVRQFDPAERLAMWVDGWVAAQAAWALLDAG